MPVRVVAPTSVKRGMSTRIDRAEGPLPMTRSRRKSSIAGYRISSTVRARRWISSMKSTSRSWRFVRIAARSPARSSTGPEVTLKPTPSSEATMWASVVLPRPGLPAKSRWSAGSSRALAASRMIERCSLVEACPTKSTSVRGRSDRSSSISSMTRSSGDASGASMRSVMPSPAPGRRAAAGRPGPCPRPRRRARPRLRLHPAAQAACSRDPPAPPAPPPAPSQAPPIRR